MSRRISWWSLKRILSCGFLATGCVSQNIARQSLADISVSSRALDGSKEVWQEHKDYLAMTTPYEPIRGVFEQIQKRQTANDVLRNRGEAHVTVMTPPEFALLSSKITIDEINKIAQQEQIQKARLEPVCIGSGRAVIEGHEEKTFFLVLRAPDLLRIRQKIAEQFMKNGGEKGKFDAQHFYPHITIGFTKTDLHEQQGVIKDSRSCEFSLKIINQ